MSLVTLLFSSFFIFNTAVCQSPAHSDRMLLDTSLTDLKGRQSAIIINNRTTDTLRFTALINYYLPIESKEIKVVLFPGNSYSLIYNLYYPDFVEFTGMNFSIYNEPGKIVTCNVLKKQPIDVDFKGPLATENNYYQYYFKSFVNNQAYYKIGAGLKDFNKFPGLADSLNRINLTYLNNHSSNLSAMFKQYEFCRLNYNNAFLKYHVLFDKEFKTAKKISIASDYYQFENEVPLNNKGAVLSTAYLWYAVFSLRQKALAKDPDEKALDKNMLTVIDSIYSNNEIGDAVRMRILYGTYSRSKPEYLMLAKTTTFINPDNRLILDSVVHARHQLPLKGNTAPDFKLTDIHGDSISLNSYLGHPIIINFWATWCMPCIKEFVFENNIYAIYHKLNGTVVINICVDSKPGDWKKISIANNLQMVNLYADSNQYEQLKKFYNLYAFPRSIFIDSDLKVVDNNYKRASQLQKADIVKSN